MLRTTNLLIPSFLLGIAAVAAITALGLAVIERGGVLEIKSGSSSVRVEGAEPVGIQ